MAAHIALHRPNAELHATIAGGAAGTEVNREERRKMSEGRGEERRRGGAEEREEGGEGGEGGEERREGGGKEEGRGQGRDVILAPSMFPQVFPAAA